MKYAVSHSYRDLDGVWHEAEFVNVKRFKEKDVGRLFITDKLNWVFHHTEGTTEVYMYPGHLCTPPIKNPFLETQKMFLREVDE